MVIRIDVYKRQPLPFLTGITSENNCDFHKERRIKYYFIRLILFFMIGVIVVGIVVLSLGVFGIVVFIQYRFVGTGFALLLK